MVKFIISIVAFLSTTFLFAQNQNELNQEIRKKNKISEMLTYEYNLNGSDSILVDHNYYDTKGNLLKDLRFNPDGKVRFKYLIEYDENNLMTKQVGFDEFDSISTILIYEHDKQGNQIIYKQLNPDGKILNFQKRAYNKEGRNTKLYTKIRNSDDFYLSQRYYYRKDGQYEKIKIYNVQGQLVASSEYEYDENGNLIFTFRRIGDERKITFLNKYDNQNQLIERFYPNQISKIVDDKLVRDSNSKKIEYDYDSEGNLIEEKTFKNDELIEKVRYYYKRFDN